MSFGINFNSYNNFNSSYGISQIPVVRPEDVQTGGKANENVSVKQPEALPEQNYSRAPKTANLENISLTFNKEDTFDNIGSDADITNLDMTKAISDMKRDSILADYQTFVGPSADMMMSSEVDGVVIPK